MARLPVPGNDEGTWGDILNDFLAEAHTTSGALKPNSVGPAQLQDNAITSSSVADGSIPQDKIQNLSSDLAATEKAANKGAVNGYAPLDGSGKVPSVNLPTAGAVPDADASTKGVLKLAGDLGGSADLPTVPGLASKATDAAVVHNTGSETIAGNKNFTDALTHSGNAVIDATDARLADARTPLAHKTTHASGGSDALSPSDINAVGLAGSNTATLANSTLQYLRVNIPNDGSDTATWPDRMAFYYAGIRTGYHNEYGELRARPGKNNTVALRAMGFNPSSTGDIFQVAATDAATIYLGVSSTQVTANVPVITPNLPRKITTSNTAPSSPQDGDIWFDTSGV